MSAPLLVTEMRRPIIADTPCARCGHAHAGSDQFWAGNTRTFLEQCGEWMSSWSPTGAGFWECNCPEWSVPPHRCRCGRTSLVPFRRWLNGTRACSAECASVERLKGEAA